MVSYFGSRAWAPGAFLDEHCSRGSSHRCAKAAVVTVAFALSRHQHASKLAATVISGCKSDNFFATSFSNAARFLTRHLEPPTAQDTASTARRIAGGAASGVLHTPQSLDVGTP